VRKDALRSIAARQEIAYTDTEHYKLTKAFLDSPERFFKHLFESSNDEDAGD